MSHANMDNRAQTQEYIAKVAEQSKISIVKQIEGDFQTLHGMAAMIGSMEDADYDDLMPTIKNVNDNNAFLRMGFVDKNGTVKGVDVDGTGFEDEAIIEQESVERAFTGEDIITSAQKVKNGTEYVNHYAVPINKDGKTAGVLYAANNSEVLEEIMDTAAIDGEDNATIVDSEGNFVLRVDNSSAGGVLSNILDYISLDGEDAQRVRVDFGHNKSGMVEYTDGGETHWAAYTPIGINDWYVMSVVHGNAVNESFTEMTIGMLGIILSAILIFLLFVFMIKRTNARNHHALEEVAYTDELTGYSNYPKFLIDAEKLLLNNKDKKYTFWYSDLKNFKYVNDMFGYEVGDRVLRYWANVIEGNLREGETFCRASGDKFMALRVYTSKEEAEQRFNWAAEQLANYWETAEQGYKLELCAGIYCVSKEDENIRVSDMIDRANVAQKSIKSDGGIMCAFYSDEMRERILTEAKMERLMENAIKNEEFQVYLQPKIDIQHGDVLAGAEALVRWKSPELGMLPPNSFIPLFERNGFIVKLDKYMLEQACRIIREHLDSGDPKIILAVNVSRLCMRQEYFVQSYVDIKNKYNIPDNCIELEFTESIAVYNHELFRDIVRKFQQNGFVCSLDDFGSGQSSLNILKDIPVDILKLDMLFFHEENEVSRARALVRGIIDIAKGLGILTVAEGVESMEQVEFLRSAGCDMVQGFVFAKSMLENEFTVYSRPHVKTILQRKCESEEEGE
ncbi:MAG: EAL domain-containing protein [Christensenella sp.]